MAKKSRNALWFGFLEAGSKGSPVVRESGLETGNRDTIYLFNLLKGRILEYRRDIVEPKLRELTVEEGTMIPELRKAFKVVRESFEPRPLRLRPSTPRIVAPRKELDLSDFADDVELDFDPGLVMAAGESDDGDALDQLD